MATSVVFIKSFENEKFRFENEILGRNGLFYRIILQQKTSAQLSEVFHNMTLLSRLLDYNNINS